MLEASERKHTLLDFRYRHLFKALSGKHGSGQNKHGRGAEDLVLEVPVGTVVKDPETGESVADLAQPGERWVAAKGGRGGRGNARFVTFACRVPREAEDGQEGEEHELILELKLIADVGLVGFPNAGKSTLIAAISAARPKIADYPFTTLIPNLGVVQFEDARPFVVADIPGLIDGAHEGAGLGTRFLRHVERTRILLHVIDAGQIPLDDPLDPYRRIEYELASYSDTFAEKERIIALNKIDMISSGEELEGIETAYRGMGHAVFCISALKRQGLRELILHLTQRLSPPEGDEPRGEYGSESRSESGSGDRSGSDTGSFGS